MGTYVANAGKVQQRWFVVDGTDRTLGHLATKIAKVLMGKHRPEYTPHVDTGDFVVVINAAHIRVSPANKERKRFVTHHTGYLGNLRREPLADAFERNPAKVVGLAVKRMLPKNTLARTMFAKLKVYPGPEHPHAAQKPQPFPENV